MALIEAYGHLTWRERSYARHALVTPQPWNFATKFEAQFKHKHFFIVCMRPTGWGVG